MNIKLVAFASAMLGLFCSPFQANASAVSINFDTPGDLTNNFTQVGALAGVFYNQTTTGGITGGAVSGYTGNDYFATAVYNGAFNISNPGATVQMSASFLYNGQLTPLVPEATGIRSFRLGLLGSSTSAFETVPSAAAYVEGMISLQPLQPQFFGWGPVNQTAAGVMTASGVMNGPGLISIVPNEWYRLDATFTNKGAGQIQIAASFFDLGQNGLASPTLLNSGTFTEQNVPIASLSSAYAGFSVLTGGGFSELDNFEVDGPLSAVPEPSTWAMMILGFLGIGWIACRRESKPPALMAA
jgi:hypothetical protein